jgi:hypothetical protein
VSEAGRKSLFAINLTPIGVNRHSKEMTKLYHLTNPNGTLVKSAWIAESNIGSTLNVQTIYGSDILGYRTLRGAKQAFASNFQIGGKWEIGTPQRERSGT